MTEKITTWDPMKRKDVVAGILIDGTLIKKVKDIHFMRIFQAYGLSTRVMLKIRGRCDKVRIISDKGIREVAFSTWVTDAIKKDFGHGLQFFYPWAKMDEVTV